VLCAIRCDGVIDAYNACLVLCRYGPKDLPVAARAAGKMAGQAVAFLKQVRMCSCRTSAAGTCDCADMQWMLLLCITRRIHYARLSHHAQLLPFMACSRRRDLELTPLRKKMSCCSCIKTSGRASWNSTPSALISSRSDAVCLSCGSRIGA